MITVEMGKIMNSVTVLNKLVDKNFKGRKAFVAARLAREINKECDTFNNARFELVKKYGEKDENGELKLTDGQARIPDEMIEQCNAELTELQNTTVELNVDKMPIDWLEDIELTMADADALEPFVDFGNE